LLTATLLCGADLPKPVVVKLQTLYVSKSKACVYTRQHTVTRSFVRHPFPLLTGN